MGDRALIQLTNGNETSPVLYLHWGRPAAMDIIEEAERVLYGECKNAYGIGSAFAYLVKAALNNDQEFRHMRIFNMTEKMSRGNDQCSIGEKFLVDISDKDDWSVFDFI